MEKPIISVVIPVYNAERFIRQCVESVLAQTFQDFEIILVNDGSTDDSGRICDQLAQEDARIGVYHQENGGATRARALGVSNAQGEWINFVDADDTLPSDSLEVLHAPTLTHEYGMVLGRIKATPNTKDRLESAEKFRHSMVRHRYGAYPHSKIIRRSLFDRSVFEIPREINFFEDWLMLIRLTFKNTQDVLWINKKVYNYNEENTDSCTNNFKHTADYYLHFMKYFFDSIPDDVQNEYLEDSIKARIYILKRGFLPTKNKWRKTQFHYNLLDDIKKSRTQLSKSTALMLSTNDFEWTLFKILYKIKTLKK